MSARYAEPLELGGLSRDGTRQMIVDFVAKPADPLSPTIIEDLVDRAFQLDPERRPLFGLIAALEFLDPQLSGGSRDTVLRALVSRRNAQDSADKPLDYRVLELSATALGGIDIGDYPALQDGQVPPFSLPDLSALAPADVDRALVGMVPDILGEMWILDELAAEGTRAGACKAALDVAWAYSPIRYAAFLDRAARDHPFHEKLLELLNVDCDRDPKRWFEMACSVLPHLRDPRSLQVATVLYLLRTRPPSDRRAEALAKADAAVADLWFAAGELESAHELYTKVIETAPVSSEAIWHSYTNRGVVELSSGDPARAEADFAAVISSSDAGDEARACCLNNRADMHANEGEHLAAIEDRTAVLGLQATTYNRRYIALARRAMSLWALGRFEEANSDIAAILSTPDIAVEQKMNARLMRSQWAANMGTPEIAEDELNQIMASRRNFPSVAEAAQALAVELGIIEDPDVGARTIASG